MNLIIDQGNSFFKVGLFEHDELIDFNRFGYDNLNHFNNWIQAFEIQHCIVSSVVDTKIELHKINLDQIIYLDHHTPIPIENNYGTPQTLGRDRLANVIGAWSINPDQASLVIDGGTCIKYDIINASGTYIGGNIAPGLNMRYQALEHFTEQLPKLQPVNFNSNYGTDTTSSLHAGVLLGYNHEINGFINRYEIEFNQLTIFMTGGDLNFFDKTDKKHIFAIQNLTLIGLNEILRYNVE